MNTLNGLLMLTGEELPAEALRNTKISNPFVYMERLRPFQNISMFRQVDEGVVLSDRNNAFVFLRRSIYVSKAFVRF